MAEKLFLDPPPVPGCIAYNLTAGEIEINDKDKSKSAGVLYPAAQLVINKEGQLQIELRKNSWKLVNIID